MAPVCVTGGSGFIASWLIKLLLEHGYTVRATVRDPGNLEKTAHLWNLPHANERLELVKADLLDECSFDAAVEGCKGVFHTASPVAMITENPELWYQLSKLLAEETAWAFAKEKGLDLVAINPGMVVGWPLQPSLDTGSKTVLEVLTGAESFFQHVSISWVDVRDVAEAHLLAFEVPTASGRYLCTNTVFNFPTLLEVLQKIIGGHPLPPKCVDKPLVPAIIFKLSTEKLQGLGLTCRPIEDALKETVDCLIQRGLL